MALLIKNGTIVTAGDRYTADIWARRAGVSEARVWSVERAPEDPPQAQGQLSCDTLGCLFSSRGQRVALVKDARALAEDCGTATLVVALVPVPRGTCPGPQVVIDRFDLWRNGAYAVWLSPDRIVARSVRQTRGERPWVRKPESRSNDGHSASRP